MVNLASRSVDVGVVNLERSIKSVVGKMNAHHCYVDEKAKRYWLREHPSSEQRFEDRREQVADMFRRLHKTYEGNQNEVILWVNELLHPITDL